MGQSKASAAILSILNLLQTIFALALGGVAIWFYVEVQRVIGHRNVHRYLLDYNVYWPQAVPWLFVIVGVLMLCVSCCGVAGARRKSKFLINTYVLFEVIVILALVVLAAITIVFGDSKSTDKFVTDTILDVFAESKTVPAAELAYNNFETRFQCCGSTSPRDYVSWRTNFPKSCCRAELECDFSDKIANEMFGCSIVAMNYTKVAMRILAAGSAFTAIIGIFNVIIAIVVLTGLKKKPNRVVEYHESESKKVLL